jgi:hypothetical protein
MEGYDMIRVHGQTMQDAAQDSRIEELERSVKLLREHNGRMMEEIEKLHLRARAVNTPATVKAPRK